MEDKTKRNEEENRELKTKDKHYDELVEKIENISMDDLENILRIILLK